jgi:DNA-binding beta-propeller fold protein YncE
MSQRLCPRSIPAFGDRVRVRRYSLLLPVLSFAGAPQAVGQETPEPPEASYFVYVAAESQDEVALVRFGPQGTEVAQSIPVGRFPADTDGPHGIAVDPSGSRWYVSIAHGLPFGEVHSYGTETNDREGRVEVGLFPASMSVAPTGLLFVANFNLHGDPVPSTVSVVDTEAMVEVARITTCAMPHGSRISGDGRLHYSTCMMDEQLVEIDTRALQVSRRLFLGPGRETALPAEAARAEAALGEQPAERGSSRCGPTWVQPSPTGAFAYVACNKNREVLEVAIKDWRVTRRFATGPGPYNLDVTPDGRLVVVTYKGGEATGIIDLEAGAELAAVPSTRRLPHGVAISPDSRYAFISIEGVGVEPGTVDVIDLSALTRVGSVDVGRQAGGIGFWRMTAAGS